MTPTSTRPYILIVHDTPTELQILITTLINTGFDAVVTTSPMALQQATAEPPILILLDLLPDLEGFATCQQLKANPVTAAIPIIFMTADTANQVKGLALGAVDYISKPLVAETVLARVRVHIQLQTLTRSLAQKDQELETSLYQLHLAQQQIMQQEKLAALGALTAGVTHELRNPLNFVTNYAEASVELINEISTELDQHVACIGADQVETLQELLCDLRENAVSIHNHGQRADSVIQTMLVQARSDHRTPHLFNLNALLEQAVKLTYLSYRAHNPDFAMTMDFNYDPKLSEQRIFSADLSRALINLVDNACYVLHQKQRAFGSSFTPTLSVATQQRPQDIEIRIRDNGMGISASVLTKIFQSFFTTKPPGKGTGLGLSLAYDTIVQHYQGTLTCETTPGDYTEFIIRLPHRRDDGPA